jgi:hypothetical protein
MCYTDLRSSKVQEIQAHPRISWLFYHPQEKIQLRLAGPASLQHDEAVLAEHWAELSKPQRRDYSVVKPPGSPLIGPGLSLPDKALTSAESEAGRENFVIIRCQVDWLDWLLLHDEGHFRAQFTWQEDKLWARWVTP